MLKVRLPVRAPLNASDASSADDGIRSNVGMVGSGSTAQPRESARPSFTGLEVHVSSRGHAAMRARLRTGPLRYVWRVRAQNASAAICASSIGYSSPTPACAGGLCIDGAILVRSSHWDDQAT